MAQAMATARCVRRASPRCTLPKVSSAHCRADNMLLAFIIAAPSLERFFILPGGILPPLDEKLVINSQAVALVLVAGSCCPGCCLPITSEPHYDASLTRSFSLSEDPWPLLLLRRLPADLPPR